MHLLVIRHGKPDDPDPARPVDPPLSARGRWQADRVADRLAREGVGRIVASPLKRAFATAQPLAERTGLEIEVVDQVAEVDARGGHYATVEMLRGRQNGDWERFLADPVGLLGGGDTETFRADVLSGFGQILEGNHARKVAVFTHGIPINALLGHVFGFPELTRIAPYYCSITRLAGTSLRDLQVLSINETGHFEPGEL
jgi:broad specificity phosphatase PhoE